MEIVSKCYVENKYYRNNIKKDLVLKVIKITYEYFNY